MYLFPQKTVISSHSSPTRPGLCLSIVRGHPLLASDSVSLLSLLHCSLGRLWFQPPAWLQDTPRCLSSSPWCWRPPFVIPSFSLQETDQSSFLFCSQNIRTLLADTPITRRSPPQLLYLVSPIFALSQLAVFPIGWVKGREVSLVTIPGGIPSLF